MREYKFQELASCQSELEFAARECRSALAKLLPLVAETADLDACENAWEALCFYRDSEKKLLEVLAPEPPEPPKSVEENLWEALVDHAPERTLPRFSRNFLMEKARKQGGRRLSGLSKKALAERIFYAENARKEAAMNHEKWEAERAPARRARLLKALGKGG